MPWGTALEPLASTGMPSTLKLCGLSKVVTVPLYDLAVAVVLSSLPPPQATRPAMSNEADSSRNAANGERLESVWAWFMRWCPLWVFVVTLPTRNRDRLLVGALAPPSLRCGPLLNAT